MDPLIGRMMAADPNVTNPSDGQAWNRYSYVGNDPLNLTDPTGCSWFSDFFNSIGSFFASIIKAVIQIVVTAVLTYFLGPAGLGLAKVVAGIFAAAGAAAVVTGVSGGNLGDMLRSAAIAGATAIAFWSVGEASAGVLKTGNVAGAYAVKVAGHAAVGCASTAASGGSCASGALSAAVSAAAGPLIPTKDFVGGLVMRTVIGGTVSIAAGGKFENGAVTAAFGYLFNHAMHSATSRNGDTGGQAWGGREGTQYACLAACVGDAVIIGAVGPWVVGAAAGAAAAVLAGWWIYNNSGTENTAEGPPPDPVDLSDMRKLSKGDVKVLKENDVDPHDLKGGDSTLDLYRDKRGVVWIGNKDGTGAPEATGININDLRNR